MSRYKRQWMEPFLILSFHPIFKEMKTVFVQAGSPMPMI